MSTFARIANLDDLQAWTSAGFFAQPRLEFSVSDPDGDAIASIIIRLYSTAGPTGGLIIAYTLTGATLATALANGYYEPASLMASTTERWWTIESTDSTGESSGESTRTAYKVRFAQAIYEYAVPSGATSSAWDFSHAVLPANTDAAFLFRTATGTAGAGASAWKKNISELTPGAYLNVLVRLSTYLVGTNATLDDMTFSYLTTATQPDHWTPDATSKWSVEQGKFRYGTKAYKFNAVSNSAVRTIQPYRVTPGDDILVQPNTDYTLSCYVNTDGPFSSGGNCFLQVYRAGGVVSIKQGTTNPDAYDGGVGATVDSSSYPEGWQRLHIHFHTDASTTVVRPMFFYIGGLAGAADHGWVDAFRLEEGNVASPYAPSFLSDAGVWDSYNLTLDGTQGMQFRLKDSLGNTADLDDVVAAALGTGGGGLTNLDGGTPTTIYGGTTAVDGGAP